MKAAFVKKKNDVLIKNLEMPVPETGEVLIKIVYCGVCGTDVGMAYSSCLEYTPLGHEFVGKVVKTGPGVTHLKVGDRVTAECSTACGICKPCREFNSLACEDITCFFAKVSGFAEYIKIPARNAVKIGNMDYKLATLIEPFSVALCMVNLAEPTVDDEILIIGAGPIGLLSLAACREMGAKKVYIAEKKQSKARLKMAKELGADGIIEVDDKSTVKSLAEKKGLTFDKILVSAHPAAITDSVHLCRKGGIISYTAYSHGNDKITLDADLFHAKHLQLRAYDGPAMFFPRAINLLERGIINPDKFITHTFKLKDLKDALRTAAEDRETAIKVTVEI